MLSHPLSCSLTVLAVLLAAPAVVLATVFVTVMPVGLTGKRRVSGPFAPTRPSMSGFSVSSETTCAFGNIATPPV